MGKEVNNAFRILQWTTYITGMNELRDEEQREIELPIGFVVLPFFYSITMNELGTLKMGLFSSTRTSHSIFFRFFSDAPHKPDLVHVLAIGY